MQGLLGQHRRAPRALDGRRVHTHDLDFVLVRRCQHRPLGIEFRALVVGEERAAVGGLLGSDRPFLLSERRSRRGIHDPFDVGARSGPDDVLRPTDIDLEHRRGVPHAEGVRSGRVVDEAAAAHRGRERLGVEHVPPHRLGAQLGECAGRGFGAGQRFRALAVLQ